MPTVLCTYVCSQSLQNLVAINFPEDTSVIFIDFGVHVLEMPTVLCSQSLQKINY